MLDKILCMQDGSNPESRDTVPWIGAGTEHLEEVKGYQFGEYDQGVEE